MRIYKVEEKPVAEIVSTVLDLADEDIQHLESVDYGHPETLELDSGVVDDEVIEYAHEVLDIKPADIQIDDPELQRAIDEFKASRGTHRKAVEPTPIPSVDDMLVDSEDSEVEEPLEPKKGLWSRILGHFKKPVEDSQDFSSYFEDEEQISESDESSSEPEELFFEYDEKPYKLDEQVSEPDEPISESDEQVSEPDESISEFDEQVPEPDESISESDAQVPESEELFSEYDEQPYKLELENKDVNSEFTESNELTFDNPFSFYPPLESVAEQNTDSEELDGSYEGYSPIISVEPGDVEELTENIPTRSTVNTEKVDKFYWVKLGIILFICSLLLGTSVYFAMNFRLIHVSGDSMYPTLKDGQQVIVQTNIEPSMGDIAVFKHTGTNIIKRVWGTPKGVSHIPEMCTAIMGSKGGVQDMYSVYCDVKLNGYYVVGDNVYNSQDSNSYGVLKPDSLVGVVRGVL